MPIPLRSFQTRNCYILRGGRNSPTSLGYKTCHQFADISRNPTGVCAVLETDEPGADAGKPFSIRCFLLHRASRGGILYVSIKPTDHLIKRMLYRLAGRIAVSFIRQGYETNCGSIPSKGLVHAFRLDRESA